jgi:hypothetical protein
MTILPMIFPRFPLATEHSWNLKLSLFHFCSNPLIVLAGR